MSKKNDKKFEPISNPEFSKAMHGFRSASTCQPHTLKKYKGSRADSKRKAIREF